MENDVVYVSIDDVYTCVYWMMPIMFSCSDYIHLLINQMLLRPTMMLYNAELSLPLLLCNNWMIGCYFFYDNIKDSENNEKIELVQSINIKTDQE